MPNCLERHSLCTETNWGLPTQHFQKGIIVWVSIKKIKKKKKKKKKEEETPYNKNYMAQVYLIFPSDILDIQQTLSELTMKCTSTSC